VHRPSKPMLVLALLAAAGLLASCSQPPQPVRPEVRYYLESSQSLHAIHRVVFIQLDGGTRHPQIASVMTEALFAALQDRGIFQVDVMSEDHPQCQDLPLRSREGFTIEQLNAIRQALRCDAVLLGEVTQFLPHPRMQAGLSLRLIDLKNGRRERLGLHRPAGREADRGLLRGPHEARLRAGRRVPGLQQPADVRQVRRLRSL